MAWTDIRSQAVSLDILKTHVAEGRVAPAYLFAGPEGVGKRRSALELAKALNCEQTSPDPCDECRSCRQISRQIHPDLHVLIPQGSSAAIGIDEVRHLISRIALRPFAGRCHVVIVDGAERLTEEAANSFLKTLEEPTDRARLVLITSQPSRCLPTIRSRCQTIRFRRLPAEVIEELLTARHQCDPHVARSISALAQGSLARALEYSAQWVSYPPMMAQLAADDPMAWLEWRLPTDRQELAQWVASSILWLRDVAMVDVGAEVLVGHQVAIEPIRRQAQAIDAGRCVETALQLVELSASMEHQLSARLIGTLLRESWLDLHGAGGGRQGAWV